MRTAAAFLTALPILLLPTPTQTPTTTPTHPPTVRIFLLAGQSNMEGQGVVDLDDARDYNGGRGTLAQFLSIPANAAEFADLRTADGTWTTRDDVFVTYVPERGARKVGALSIGFAVYEGRHHIGPELGIGRALGAQFAEPVLLIKTAWGGKSLAKDFRPPSASGETGPYYQQMVQEFRAAVASLGQDHPRLAKHRPQLDGVIWFQGWNDACDPEATAEYAANLTLLIGDLRAELGDAQMPFVVGETGNWDGEGFRRAQQRGCEDAKVAAGTRFVATRQFLRKPEDSPNQGHGHHWYGNAESYLRIGDALGRAAAELVLAHDAARQSATPAKNADSGR